MRKLVAVAAVLVVGALVGAPAFGVVVKTTVNSPATMSTNTTYSNVAYSYRVQGPGALASVNTGVFAVGSGGLTHTGAGSRTISYVQTTPGSSLNFRFVVAAVGGVQYVYAGRTSFLWWSGSATVSNAATYNVTKTVDGAVTVVISGAPVKTVTVGPGANSGTSWGPVAQFYAGLAAFTSSASISGSVSSTNTVTAAPISWGAATGSLYAFVWGS